MAKIKLYEFAVVIAAESEQRALNVLTDKGLDGDLMDDTELLEGTDMSTIGDYCHAKQDGI